MHGNVEEWIHDWYGDYTTNPQVDPKGPKKGTSKVVRGGMFSQNKRKLRSAFRDNSPTDYSFYFKGFRLVREP